MEPGGGKRKHSRLEIATKLAHANELAMRGKLQSEIARTLGVSVMTLHRWRKAAPGPQPAAGRNEPSREGTLQHDAEIKLLCQLLQLKLDRRRCSIGHHALCGGGVVASLDPPAREPRRVGACSVSARDKKPRLGRGLKCHLPEGNTPIACTTGRTTMRSSAAPVTRCFARQ
jgi:transposase-like protein